MTGSKPVLPPGLPGRRHGTSYFGLAPRPAPPAWAAYLVRVALLLLAAGLTTNFTDGYVQGSQASDEGKPDAWCAPGSASQTPTFTVAWRWGCWTGHDEDVPTREPAGEPTPPPLRITPVPNR
ncbi:hypothetical protein PV721_39210 [Streptomyces sp. MB09-01]|uniref:hypothetical protein n=1 Tax=Streptomyces sp. MB09-01 TaxID=3028666 RepID=UPI0029B6DBB5|nr:hypothetical protein [Streptomyces sp. MB09-01]MDX3540233.1 hypothetical protein [Streptomyces sp. MB09-01]